MTGALTTTAIDAGNLAKQRPDAGLQFYVEHPLYPQDFTQAFFVRRMLRGRRTKGGLDDDDGGCVAVG